ncbi:protein SICKLE-like [Bidens hawaiensis]|uniref:protein SICKLE-like n=1 Tax=Bidens hawaiensis TaxID=980011 RepID=UPI00404B8E07
MEESAQRRERLKLMRLEASQEASAAATCNDDHSTTSLSNPLLESSHESQAQQSYSHSFNYYTDPMAAYSGSRQISAPQRSQTNVTFPSPSLQPHINHLPNPRMQQPPGQYANPNHTNIRSPSWNRNNPQTHFTGSPGHGSGQGGYPGPRFTNNPGHGSGRGYPSPVPNFMNSPSHGPNQGRGHWFRNNMSSGPSSGRGMGRGRGGGGAHNHVSAKDRPDRFFNKSMVEDPWKFLEPVIWKSHSKQGLPQSLTAKKPRVSESPKQSSSQASLAEILAASFNEAANDEPNAG